MHVDTGSSTGSQLRASAFDTGLSRTLTAADHRTETQDPRPGLSAGAETWALDRDGLHRPAHGR